MYTVLLLRLVVVAIIERGVGACSSRGGNAASPCAMQVVRQRRGHKSTTSTS
jgi:hypothetical protein